MVFEKIATLLEGKTGNNNIKPETRFREDLGLDSIDLFQVVIDIEDEFNIQIIDTDNILTVEDAVKFVEKHKKT